MDDLVDLPIPAADPAEVGRRADAILSGREYRPPTRSPMERLFDWIGDRLGDFIGVFAGGGRGSLVGVVILGLAAAFVVWLIVRRGSFRVGSPTVLDRPSLRSEIDQRVAPDEWFAEAERLLGAGDHGGAIRCWYQGTVETLRDRGSVALDPGRTVGEYRGDLQSASPELQGDFAALSERFLDAWYGGCDMAAADVESCRRLAGSIVDSGSLAGATR